MNATRMLAAMPLMLAVFAVSAVGAWAGPFESPIEQANRESSERMWAGARDQLTQQIWEFNKQIAEARAQFWATYPDKPGAAEAQKRFSDLLRQKDAYYLAVALGGRLVDAGVEEQLDGGIRRSASPEFDDLVKAATERFRVGDMMQMGRQFFSAIDCCPTLYKAYVIERDWWEFDHVQRIPVGCAKPETYGACLYRRWGKVTGDEAGAMYDAMFGLLGMQVVYDAAQKVMSAPKTDSGLLVVTVPEPWKIGPGGSKVADDDVPMPDGVIGVYSNPLLALQILSTKDDDRRYLLYLLKGQWDRNNLSLAPTQWAFAAMLYDRLKIAFGEKDVLEAARALRTAKKRMTDGWVMDPKAIGSTRMTPFSALEDILSRKNPRGYVRNALMFNLHDAQAAGGPPLKTPAEVDAAYKKFVSENGEDKVLNAAKQMAAERPNLNYFGELVMLKKVLDGSLTFKKPPAPETLVDFPEYLKWKKFAPGTKVSYATRLWQPDRLSYQSPVRSNRLIPEMQHHQAYQLQSINDEQAKLWFTETSHDRFGNVKPGRDTEIFYQAKAAKPAKPAPDAPAPAGYGGVGAKRTSAPIESGEETVQINGKPIATQWQSASYEYDGYYDGCRVIVKVWTSDEVPTGLVRRTEDKTCTGAQYGASNGRFISETYLESFDGFTPAVPDPSKPVTTAYVPPPSAPTGVPRQPETAPAPPKPTPQQPPAPPRTQAPVYVPPAGLLPAASAQAALAQRFTTLGTRARNANGRLARSGTPLPAEITAARARMDAELKAAIIAYQKQDSTEAEQHLQSAEDSLTVMEKYAGY